MNLKIYEAYSNELIVKAIPGSSHQVNSSKCALIEFLFSSISMIFFKINSESTFTGKGLKYPFSPVKHIFDSWLSSLQLFKSDIFNPAVKSFKLQNTKIKYLNPGNIVTENLTNWGKVSTLYLLTYFLTMQA